MTDETTRRAPQDEIPSDNSESRNESPPAEDGVELPPLRSVHTSNFPQILEQFGMSLLVTTYQAGRLVLLRNDGGVLNTHFRAFQKPMGLAVDSNRFALGTGMEVIEFHNLPAVSSRLDPPNRHDACFLPRTIHFTGDIQIHEMAWVGDDVWFVNTLFSCLCTRSGTYSFEPRWRPSFVTEYVPGDYCHLNGMAVVDGRPRYVTALGETNHAGGWRDNKRDGGILIDMDSNEIIARRLSMPHSPRVYDGKLWLLESGTGTLGTIDLQTGRYESIAAMPGFTRGLAFCGPLAFVGLSQVRETAVFGGIPIAEQLSERTCGVWVVNIHSGEVVAFLKFEDAVQEIFAVDILSGMTYPDIINDDREILAASFELPDDALAQVPPDLRSGISN